MEWCKGFWSKTVTMYIKDIILPILLRHGILFFIFFLLSFFLSFFLIYFLSPSPSFALSLLYDRSLTIHLFISFFLSLIFCTYIIRSHITTGARPTSTMYLQMYGAGSRGSIGTYVHTHCQLTFWNFNVLPYRRKNIRLLPSS